MLTRNLDLSRKNHSADCYRVIPSPDVTYFESRVICVCGLERFNYGGDNGSQNNQDKTSKESNSP